MLNLNPFTSTKFHNTSGSDGLQDFNSNVKYCTKTLC